jgi:hypothetical protein
VLIDDPGRNILLLDIARFHLMSGMGNTEMMNKNLPSIEEALDRYLGLKSRIKYGSDKEEADRLSEEANKLDPYYSKAMGIPTPDLFVPLGEESHNHRYLFQPL